jgi:hypothetical protein
MRVHIQRPDFEIPTQVIKELAVGSRRVAVRVREMDYRLRHLLILKTIPANVW